MRTPDEEASGGDPNSLADGYGAADPDAPGDAIDDNYGDGFNDSAAASDPYGSGSEGGSLDPFGAIAVEPDSSLYDSDPGDVATDSDLDLTGDGTVDTTDAIEGVTALLSFGMDHVDDDQHAAHHDDGGLFDL